MNSNQSILCIRMIFLIGMLFLTNCSLPEPVTSAHGKPEDITFLNLPNTVTNVAYWVSADAKIATFAIAEKEFKKLFKENLPFEEINKPYYYPLNKYGNPKEPPFSGKLDAKASNGLIYKRIERDGGGVIILYDRDKGLGYYDWSMR